MKLAKNVRGTVEASESLRGEIGKDDGEVGIVLQNIVYLSGRGGSVVLYTVFIRIQNGLHESRCFATSSSYHRVNRESKRLDRVLVAEFVDGEQFVTEEIIKEGNRWPNIEVILKRLFQGN
ncbi:hypothetical protein Tco_0980623 [Tanacetum coccineum]